MTKLPATRKNHLGTRHLPAVHLLLHPFVLFHSADLLDVIRPPGGLREDESDDLDGLTLGASDKTTRRGGGQNIRQVHHVCQKYRGEGVRVRRMCVLSVKGALLRGKVEEFCGPFVES